MDKEGWGSGVECFDNNPTSLYGSQHRTDEQYERNG